VTSGKIYGALIGAVFMVGGMAPADAQVVRIPQAAPDQVLPVYEIVAILRSTGLDPLGAPVRQGVTYRLRAVDRAGRDLNVVVDARYGDILLVERATDGPYPDRRIVTAPPGYYDDPELFDHARDRYADVPLNPPPLIRPKPTPRVAAMPVEKHPPLPKPRPEAVAAQSAPAAASAATVPAAAPPASKPETAPAQDTPVKWKDEPAPTNVPAAALKVPDVTPLE
jgi:hypothetical protein